MNISYNKFDIFYKKYQELWQTNLAENNFQPLVEIKTFFKVKTNKYIQKFHIIRIFVKGDTFYYILSNKGKDKTTFVGVPATNIKKIFKARLKDGFKSKTPEYYSLKNAVFSFNFSNNQYHNKFFNERLQYHYASLTNYDLTDMDKLETNNI